MHPMLFTSRTLLELSNCSWSRAENAKEDIQPYLRGCKWSPDGFFCLSVVNNDGVNVITLPKDFFSVNHVTVDRMIDVLDPEVHVKEAGLVYDFCWYPGMNSNVPETCCWITTRQNAPIQLWHAFDGTLRCSYRGFNAVDEMEPAISITFSADAAKIIAGYKKVLRMFDVERPGREFTQQKISTPASCLATTQDILAVGSWNSSISIYAVNELGTYKSLGKMHGHAGGVTHLKFASDGIRLLSGSRKDHRLLVWDIRYYRRPLHEFSRVVDTNQRIYFDISPSGKYLVSGGTDGVVKVWNLDNIDPLSSLEKSNMNNDVIHEFPLHKDCCNSVSIHPWLPILATGSGQYHFRNPISDEDLHSIEQSASQDLNISDLGFKYSRHAENSLVFWWIGDVTERASHSDKTAL